jgi:hypothetical protein
MSRALLVTGIHREELDFGDRVAALVDPDQVEVLRIARGISNARTGTRGQFYSDTEHREIYLQLRQQLHGHSGPLIDLHAGIDEHGPCADIYSPSEALLACLGQELHSDPRVRLVRIVDSPAPGDETQADALARTRIPRALWDDRHHIYVGLEVYLAQPGAGGPGDWQFARELIQRVCDCGAIC